MKTISMTTAFALALALTACGESQGPVPRNSGASAGRATQPPGSQVYAATGEVTAISGGRVTISHGPVEGLGWPSMTMAFEADAPAMVQGIEVGDAVSFQFREADGSYRLTSLTKTR